MSKRDKALSEELRERAMVCHARGDYPSWKVMNRAANRLAQIEREDDHSIMAEREACAVTVENIQPDQPVDPDWFFGRDQSATAIRSRP